jgi:formylglycine-generating enzyme required for sulfatase activity
MDADERQFASLFPKLQRFGKQAADSLLQELRKPPEQVDDRDKLARRQAQAGVALLRLEAAFQLNFADMVWPLLRQSSDPSRRTYLIHALGPLGAPKDAVTQRLAAESDVSVRRALILSLGQFSGDQLPAEERQRLRTKLLDWYRNDPDPGVHGAIDWLLRHAEVGPAARKLVWGRADALADVDQELAGQAAGECHWYVTHCQEHTLTVVRAPGPFFMGSPPDELDRFENEVRHLRCIGRSFAIGTKEVTKRQFQEFLEAYRELNRPLLAGPEKAGPHEDGPVQRVTWFEAVQYCRWLSEQEGFPETEMCYPPVQEMAAQIKDGKGIELPANCLTRTGYRLPTEAEWEYACRADAETSRAYGASKDLLRHYGWYRDNSEGKTWPVGQLKPNDLGLFDVYGNVWEWCNDPWRDYPGAQPTPNKMGTRLWRGGSFDSRAENLRTADRNSGEPGDPSGNNTIGFRIARTYKPPG